MLKKLFFLILLVTSVGVFAQGKFIAKNAYISFYSSTPLEDILGESNEVVTILDSENGEVVFELEGEKLCLINTEIIMLKEGKIIFTGKDEEFNASEDPYILKFVRGK